MDCKNMPTSTKYKYIYGCKRFLIGKYIIQIMTGMKGNNEGISPEVRNFVRRKVQNVAQIYSEHFCFCYTTKQTKNLKKKDWHCHNQVWIWISNICLHVYLSRSGVEDWLKGSEIMVKVEQIALIFSA